MDYLEKRTVKYAAHIFKDPAREAFAKLKKYYDESSEVLTVATVLDPTLKTKWHEYPHLKKAGALPTNKQAAAGATPDASAGKAIQGSGSGGTTTEVSQQAEKAKKEAQVSLKKVREEVSKRYNNYKHLSATTAKGTRKKKAKAAGKGKRKRRDKERGKDKRKKRRKSTPMDVARERVAELQVGSKPANELANYLEQKTFRAPDKFNICHWWRAYELQSPALAAMARDILAIQATSAPSERAFSFARHVVTEFRASLAPNTIRALLCLKTWLGSHEAEEDDSEGEEEDPMVKGKGKGKEVAEDSSDSDTDDDSDSEGETSRMLGSDSEDSTSEEDEEEEKEETGEEEDEEEDEEEEGSNASE